MSRTKRLFVPLSPYEQQAMESLLEKQAAQGWLLTKLGSWFWTFTETEARSLHFSVTYFSKATEYDSLPTDDQRDKEALCAQSGWHLAARRHDMQVFYTADADALPLETDSVVRVEQLHKTMAHLTIRPRLFTLALCLVWILKYWLDFRHDSIRFLSSSFDVISLPVWFLLLVACVVEPAACLAWYPRARHAAEEQGVFLPPHIPARVSLFLVALAVLLLCLAAFGSTLPPQWFLAWLLVCVVAILGGTLLRKHLRGKGFSAGLNKTATSFWVLAVYVAGIVVLLAVSIASHLGEADHVVAGSYEANGRTYEIYNDPLPLTVEELTQTDAVYSREATAYASPLLRRSLYEQSPVVPQYAGAPTVWYTVYDTDFAFVQDIVVRQLLSEHQNEVYEDGSVLQDSYFVIDPAPYGAQSAYQLQWSTTGPVPQYLLCWPGRVVELQFAYLVPTEEQLSKAAGILAPAA